MSLFNIEKFTFFIIMKKDQKKFIIRNISKARLNSNFPGTLIIFICFLMFLRYSYFSYHDFSIFLTSKLIKKDFTIIIHSSNKTKPRLHQFLDHYYINKSYIHYFVVYGEKVRPDPKYPYLLASSCKDDTISLAGKNAYAYEYFLNNKSLGDFLYRAMDDTFLNITNLEKLINELRLIYDPKKHIIFKGYANNLNNRIFLGGGTGWLMSRAMVEIHTIHDYSWPYNFHFSHRHQDDTTETIILKKVGFKSMKVWNDPRWAENICNSDNPADFLNGNFSSLKKCPTDVKLTPIKDMISMHGRKENKRRIALYSGNYPDNIYIYRVDNPKRDTCCFLCISDSGIVDNRTSFQYLKENSQFLTVEDLKNREPFQMSNITNYIYVDR